MNYQDIGFDKNLKRADNTDVPVRRLTAGEVDYMIPSIDGSKVSGYSATSMNFFPAKANANPSIGDMYFDKTLKKLYIFTGSRYEQVTSV